MIIIPTCLVPDTLANPQTHTDLQLFLNVVESGIPTPVRDALALKGHRLHSVPNAGISAIVTKLDPKMGTRSAGADPRRPTYAFGG